MKLYEWIGKLDPISANINRLILKVDLCNSNSIVPLKFNLKFSRPLKIIVWNKLFAIFLVSALDLLLINSAAECYSYVQTSISISLITDHSKIDFLRKST